MAVTLEQRIAQLEARRPMIKERMRAIAKGATMRAVEEAVARTPPNCDEEGKIRGEGMITGKLAESWEADSNWEPEVRGDEYVTVLANDVDYASYVNDGHDMHKHFVPGLVIDEESSALKRVDPVSVDEKGRKRLRGIMVGTKTQYVPGLYMKEAAVDVYKDVTETELRKLSQEVFK